MKVVIAPDSFKGGLAAAQVAGALAEGWREVRGADEVVEIPLADGGEGTLDAMDVAVADARRHTVTAVTGPDGRPVDAEYLLLPDDTAVVELASSSGLPLMGEPDPLGATTRGMGEVMRAALDAGARRLLVGLGGSSSTDGAAGALSALGLLLLDDDGAPVPDGGAGLARLARVERDGLLDPPSGGVECLTDVDNPLLGPRGAATVFGPQKGASPEQVDLLERALTRFAEVLGGDPAAPGAGAAGGTAYGLATVWGARLEPGSAAISRAARLRDALGGASLVVTGEGDFDATSRQGKVPGAVLGAATDADVPVAVVAGRVDRSAASGVTFVVDLSTLAGSAERSREEPLLYLTEAGRILARYAEGP
ncbi:MAG: glycerate kinase [Actinobacteria bacterium]|nr:glycerate kinase [Actinomycetota bacterium]